MACQGLIRTKRMYAALATCLLWYGLTGAEGKTQIPSGLPYNTPSPP